ncbi:MAG: MarR family transcriptional regulator [Acidimicrobiia bacterium]|nr:MarR family transcriptional regulator [Acidimicrobiia bacterium]
MNAVNLLADNRITEFGLLVEATRRVTRVIEASLREHHDLGMAEFEAMVRLGRSTDTQMSMSDLAGQMVLTSGGVTRLIDRLNARGYVERVYCPSDRRVHWAQLTDAGVAKISLALETHLADLDDHFFAVMSPEDREVAVAIFERLRSAG